jgi:transposase
MANGLCLFTRRLDRGRFVWPTMAGIDGSITLTPALLAQVLTARYCDHTPLYRQSRIFVRRGIELARSTLAGWVGGACWWLEALHDRLRKDVLASNHLFADGEARARHGSRATPNPVPVLDPGNGRTRTGRLRVHARDQR